MKNLNLNNIQSIKTLQELAQLETKEVPEKIAELIPKLEIIQNKPIFFDLA